MGGRDGERGGWREGGGSDRHSGKAWQWVSVGIRSLQRALPLPLWALLRDVFPASLLPPDSTAVCPHPHPPSYPCLSPPPRHAPPPPPLTTPPSPPILLQVGQALSLSSPGPSPWGDFSSAPTPSPAAASLASSASSTQAAVMDAHGNGPPAATGIHARQQQQQAQQAESAGQRGESALQRLLSIKTSSGGGSGGTAAGAPPGGGDGVTRRSSSSAAAAAAAAAAAQQQQQRQMQRRVHECCRDDTLRVVMERLALPGVRRLMVVHADTRRIEGVVSLSDVASYLLYEQRQQ